MKYMNFEAASFGYSKFRSELISKILNTNVNDLSVNEWTRMCCCDNYLMPALYLRQFDICRAVMGSAFISTWGGFQRTQYYTNKRSVWVQPSGKYGMYTHEYLLLKHRLGLFFCCPDKIEQQEAVAYFPTTSDAFPLHDWSDVVCYMGPG